MPDLLAGAVHRNPIRMRGAYIVTDRMRIRPGDDVHLEGAAAGHESPERVAGSEPLTAVVERNLCRVVRHDAAGAQSRGVGMQPPEIIKPERRIELAGIVLHEGQLHPAHRPVEPAGYGGLGHRLMVQLELRSSDRWHDGCQSPGSGGHLQEIPAGQCV